MTIKLDPNRFYIKVPFEVAKLGELKAVKDVIMDFDEKIVYVPLVGVSDLELPLLPTVEW